MGICVSYDFGMSPEARARDKELCEELEEFGRARFFIWRPCRG